jgi:hypothetical protein
MSARYLSHRTTLIAAAAIGLTAPVQAQDVIYFVNGDRLSGKIKTLGRGQLILDAPAMDGNANIDWNRIARIESERVFQFQTTDGERFSGRIAKDARADSPVGEIHIILPLGERRLHQEDIVSASQTLGEGVRLIEANVGAGFSIAKSNDQKQFNVDGSFAYQTTNYRMTSSVSSIFSTQTSSTNTNRQDLNFGFARSISRNWQAGAIAGLQQSEEQQLDLRLTVGGGPVRTIVNNNHMALYAMGGAVWNHERYREDSGQEQLASGQVEGVASVSFSYFRFRKMKLDSTLRVFPSITIGGRVRGDLNSSLRIPLGRARKLWWNLSSGLLFDSSPPTNGKGTDYVTTTSVSFAFP